MSISVVATVSTSEFWGLKERFDGFAMSVISSFDCTMDNNCRKKFKYAGFEKRAHDRTVLNRITIQLYTKNRPLGGRTLEGSSISSSSNGYGNSRVEEIPYPSDRSKTCS